MRVDPPLSPVLPDIADPIDGVDELGGGPNEGEELPVEQSLEQRIGALAKRIHAAAQCPDGDRLIGELEASVLSFLQSPKKDAWAQRLSVLGKILCMGGEDLQELLKLPEYEGLTTEQKVVLVEGELDQLVDLATVRELDLSNEGLTELPACIGRLTGLATLKLCGNELKSLSSQIGRLPNLRELDLSGNALSLFPYELLQLPQLKQLNLSHNALQEIPNAVAELKRLEVLRLDHNKLQHLPDNLCRLHGLKTLDVSHNQLLSLPVQMPQLCHLDLVDLRGNPFWCESAKLRVPLQTKVIGREELFSLLAGHGH